MSIVIDHDPIQRKRVRAHNDVDGGLVLQHSQDVTELVEINKAIRNGHDGRFREDWNHAMSIPSAVVDDLVRRKIWGDPDALKKWMRSEEADPWRVHPSRDL